MYDSMIGGVRANLQAFNRSAEKVVRATLEEPKESVGAGPNSPGDLVGGMTEMMISQRGFEASISALRTALAMSAQTVDLLA